MYDQQNVETKCNSSQYVTLYCSLTHCILNQWIIITDDDLVGFQIQIFSSNKYRFQINLNACQKYNT